MADKTEITNIVRKTSFGLTFHKRTVTEREDPTTKEVMVTESEIQTGASVNGRGIDLYGFHGFSSDQQTSLDRDGWTTL